MINFSQHPYSLAEVCERAADAAEDEATLLEIDAANEAGEGRKELAAWYTAQALPMRADAKVLRALATYFELGRDMSDTPERIPYEPMDERQRAIDMVRALEVAKDGDLFDLIARLLRQIDILKEKAET